MQEIFNKSILKERRKDLRNNSTLAEVILWQNIKRGKLEGIKFRRQASIGAYVVDFYCPSKQLIVELDGEPHFTPEGIEYDKTRTEYFNSIHLNIIRFENQEVIHNLEQVLQDIKETIIKN